MPTRRIPCLFMRGGTSRGAFFLRSDLPEDERVLDSVILSVYGSPDPRQINGIGGGDALTSKVAVVAPSVRDDADVDYTFGQVGIDVPAVYWVGNCGNMSSAVGPFAIERGLVAPSDGTSTKVRIFNTNTGKTLVAHVPMRDGHVVEEGDVSIAGVPGTGAPILLDFGDCGGAVTGRILPTGHVRDEVMLKDGSRIQVSIVDAATPFVFVEAHAVGMLGTESPAEIDARPDLLARLEFIRAFAARAIGLVAEGEDAREASPSIPRVTVVSAPTAYRASTGDDISPAALHLVGRQMSMQRTHKTYAVTGTLCTAVAAAIPGTVVNAVAKAADDTFTLGHPGGVIAARVRVRLKDDISVVEAALVRTARTIMDGFVHIPDSVWPERS